MNHVLPIADEREHEESAECWCAPVVRWVDEETGMPFCHPYMIHNSADCREVSEQACGEGQKGKGWILLVGEE